jgi:energy-coupling factor transporter transmembrane protein EcfT
VPFIFYVATMFIGQSVIFTPQLTPISFEWRLFNVRYGLMMIPAAAFFAAWLFAKSKLPTRVLLVVLLILQLGLYFVGYSQVATYEDGTVGLSSAKRPDAEGWMARNYTSGLVLLDDYSRLMSIIRAGIPMQNVIYIGNKPYWDNAMNAPQDFVRWIVIQKGDAVWKRFYETQEAQDFLYSYYRKVYTSEEILIFERNID